MAVHELSKGKTDEWYTPPHVFDALKCRFDVDVASPGRDVTPWIPADRFLTKADKPDWRGFVWMNPPFGGRNGIVPWLDRFFSHAYGIALVPDRTSAPWWQEYAPRSGLVLFVTPKIKFIDKNGEPGKQPGQGTCLLACGVQGVSALYSAAYAGLGRIMEPR